MSDETQADSGKPSVSVIRKRPLPIGWFVFAGGAALALALLVLLLIFQRTRSAKQPGPERHEVIPPILNQPVNPNERPAAKTDDLGTDSNKAAKLVQPLEKANDTSGNKSNGVGPASMSISSGGPSTPQPSIVAPAPSLWSLIAKPVFFWMAGILFVLFFVILAKFHPWKRRLS